MKTALIAAFLGMAASACATPYPQRLPGPLPVPPGSERPAPPPSSGAAVTVQRISDPVWIRRVGERGDYALPFYEKRQRTTTGSLVRTGAGGRAEVLWAPDASSLALFDECRVTVGDPSQGEPLARFHSLTRALIALTPEDRVVLMGGAELVGDDQEPTATILLERCRGDILRVTNQSKLLAAITFRSERLELGPGETIDLPLLPTGAAPVRGPEAQRLTFEGRVFTFHGRLETSPEGTAVRCTALEPSELFAQGVSVRLDGGSSASFSGLAKVAPRTPADPSAQP